MDWGTLISTTTQMYRQAATETWQKISRNWWVGFLPLRIFSSLLVTRLPSRCFGGRASCCAKCMICPASTASRTAPRAQPMTSVVSTAPMPISWQKPISSAVTPAESASVSSVRLPMPMNISASGWRRRTST